MQSKQLLLNFLHQSQVVVIKLSLTLFKALVARQLTEVNVGSGEPLRVCQIFIVVFSLVYEVQLNSQILYLFLHGVLLQNELPELSLHLKNYPN
jgi:hypothetical protein